MRAYKIYNTNYTEEFTEVPESKLKLSLKNDNYKTIDNCMVSYATIILFLT